MEQDPSAIEPMPKVKEKIVRYSAPALEKGLDILEALSESIDGYTLNELAHALGRNVNEIFRMTVTLQRRGYIHANSNDRYRLTLKMFQLAHRHNPVKSLISAALPLMHELAQRARQSCHLAVYQNGRVIVVAQAESSERWTFGLKVGAVLGLTDTPCGQVILAGQDAPSRDRMLAEDVDAEAQSPAHREQLDLALDQVRIHGYASRACLQVPGVTHLAFPVRSLGERPVAAIGVPHLDRNDDVSRPDITLTKEIMSDTCRRLSECVGVT